MKISDGPITKWDTATFFIGGKLKLNLNIAHTTFAAQTYGYNIFEFIDNFYDWIIAIEISHNDGSSDQHSSLIKNSYVFDYINKLPDKPMILEFRNTSISKIEESILLMREYQNKN